MHIVATLRDLGNGRCQLCKNIQTRRVPLLMVCDRLVHSWFG